MKTNIGIEESNRKAVSQILTRVLSDEYVLLVKTKNYHWNVRGDDFSELHKFFDEQYEQLAGFTDEVAERIRSLGERTIGSMGQFLKAATLKESTGIPNSKAMIADLLKDHERLIQNLREDLDVSGNRHKDMGTSDFLTGLMEEHEKMAWMLRAYLE